MQTEDQNELNHIFDYVEIKSGNLLSNREKIIIKSYLFSKNGNKDERYELIIKSAKRLNKCKKDLTVIKLFGNIRKYENTNTESIKNILAEVGDLFGTGK